MRVVVSDKIRQVASEVEALLERNGISDSRLEAEVLLRHALQYDRAQFYASLNEHIVAQSKSSTFRILLSAELTGSLSRTSRDKGSSTVWTSSSAPMS